MGEMNGTQVEPLRIRCISRATDFGPDALITFNRSPTEAELDAMERLPPSPQIAADLGDMVRRAMTMEIVARLCRVYVIGGVAFPEGPEVTKWLRGYIDGKDGAGPLGAPMPWPDLLPATATMLRGWGFARSPNGWVMRAPESVSRGTN